MSAAEFLHNKKIDFRLFEKDDKLVGGRVYSCMNGEAVAEAGAFSYRSSDQNVIDFVNRFSLPVITHKKFMMEDHWKLRRMNIFEKTECITKGDRFEYTTQRQRVQYDDQTKYFVLSVVSTLSRSRQPDEAEDKFSFWGPAVSLPHAIAANILPRIHLNHPIKSIERLKGHFLLNENVIAEKVILATPLAALKQITIKPPLPKDKQKAISAVPYTSSKVIASLLEPFNPYENQDEWKPMLTADWDSHPGCLGGVSDYTPETIHFRQVLASPVGDLYFAGEHTAEKNGTMDGALESGLRAAKEAAL